MKEFRLKLNLCLTDKKKIINAGGPHFFEILISPPPVYSELESTSMGRMTKKVQKLNRISFSKRVMYKVQY